MTRYLTVDDAPSATLDEKLDALAARGVPALLFCEGRRLDRFPEQAVRAVRSGVHLGNHTWSHPRAADLSETAFVREVERTERRIEAVYDRAGTTRPARFFRFPYGDGGGDRAADFQRVLRDRGFVGPDRGDRGLVRADWPWTLDVGDWETDDVSELRARFESSAGGAGGSGRTGEIVLFHDAGNDPALFEAFVGWLADADPELADPLDLLP